MAQYALIPARREDLERCMDVLRSGRDFQRKQGFFQWDDNFPREDILLSDIQTGNGYILAVDGQLAGYLYLGFDGDPAYPKIQGAWRSRDAYGVIHRIAIAEGFRNQGLSQVAFALAEEICEARGIHRLCIDTHADNKRMQHVLEKNGFVYCGMVLQNGSPRMAYEKLL